VIGDVQIIAAAACLADVATALTLDSGQSVYRTGIWHPVMDALLSANSVCQWWKDSQTA